MTSDDPINDSFDEDSFGELTYTPDPPIMRFLGSGEIALREFRTK